MRYQAFVAVGSMLLIAGTMLSGCARQETAPRVGRSEVREIAPASLNELQSGQPISYYVSRFENMGYTVRNSDYQADRTIFELSKGKNVEEVTLSHQPEQNRVDQVQTRHLGWISEPMEEKAMATDKFRQEVKKLPTGKRAEEYVPMLDKYGAVTEYKLHQNDAVVNVTSDKNRYKVRLNLDPQTKVVTNIDLEKNILNMGG